MNKSFTIYLALFGFFICNFSMAQKARFANEDCKVSKVELPRHYVDRDKRTYSVEFSGDYSDTYTGTTWLRDWRKDEDNPYFKILVNMDGYEVAEPSLSSEKKQTKDGDGNVTDSWTEYVITGQIAAVGSVNIYGKFKPDSFEDMVKSDKKLQEDKEKQKQIEQLSENPFLTKEDAVEAVAKKPASSSEGEITDGYSTEYRKYLSDTKKISTAVHRSQYKAEKEYNDVVLPKLRNSKSQLARGVYWDGIRAVNRYMGYYPVTYTFYLKRVKNDDFPDATQWNQAVEASKTLFSNFKHNEGIDDAQVKFEPIISFFEGQVDKYNAEDRKQARIKKAALSNLYYILYYLDKHEKLISLANKYLDVKKLDKVSKKLVALSMEQQALLLFNKMNYAHTQDLSKDDSDDEEVVEEISAPSTDDGDDDDE